MQRLLLLFFCLACSVGRAAPPEDLHGQWAAEFFSLASELEKIDFSQSPVATDGLIHVSDAEWPFLAFFYLGLAGCNLAESDSQRRDECHKKVAWCLDRMQTRRISGFMEPHYGPLWDGPIRKPSVLVQGYTFYLMARYRQTSGDASFDSQMQRLAEAFEKAFAENPILPSYPRLWWPTDNLPAMAGLKRFRSIFPKDRPDVSEKWVGEMKKHYTHSPTGLFCAYIDPATQRPLGEPRGVALMFAIPFLQEIAPAYASEIYKAAKEHFIREVMGMSGVREFLESSTEKPDADSGEVLFGLGTSASGLAIAAAASMRDQATFWNLTQSEAVLRQMLEGNAQGPLLLPTVGKTVVLYGRSFPTLP